MDRYVVAITWLRALKIYWAHAWRAFLCGLALGIGVGVLGRILASFIHVSRPGILTVGWLLLCFVIVLCAGAWTMKRALQVRYADFAIDVTSVDPVSTATTPTTATLTESQALPVFWAMAWRAWLIFFPVNLLASYVFTGTPWPGTAIDGSSAVLLLTIQVIVIVATSTWALRIALKLDYGNWRLQLVPR